MEHLIDCYQGAGIFTLKNIELRWAEEHGPYIWTKGCGPAS